MGLAPPKLFANPSQPYQARGASLQLWMCRDEEILLEGPAGTGKSMGLLEKLNFCAMKYPGMRGLIIRKTRESCTESVLVTFEDKVLPPNSPIKEGPQRNLRQHYNYPNGSTIVVGGMDKTTKVMSTDYDMIACFESTELSLEDLEALTTRLRNGRMPYQQVICDCNPGAPSHWLNQRASKIYQKTGKPLMTRLLSRHEDNPMLYSLKPAPYPGMRIKFRLTLQGEAYITKLERLSGHRYLRLRLGKWAAAEGMVYEDFDQLTHIVDRFPIPAEWRRIRVIDFGYQNPFVCQWWAISPDGDMYLYREIYRCHRIVQVHAAQIIALSGSERYENTISDHDAEDRATLDKEGIVTDPACKAIRPGIEATQARIKLQTHNNRPRLMIFRDALVERDEELDENIPFCTAQEFDGYIYPKGQDDKPKKEEPVDKDNHGMDAMRYAVAYVDNVASMQLKVMAEAPRAISLSSAA